MEAESKVESPATSVVLTFTELPEEQDQRPDPAKKLFFFLMGSILSLNSSFCLAVQRGVVKKN